MRRWVLAIFGLELLEAVDEHRPQQGAEGVDQLAVRQLTQSLPVHVAAGHAYGAAVQLAGLHVEADPLQHVLLGPAVGVDLVPGT